MKTTLEKINEIASKEVSPWKAEAMERRKNRSWTDLSNRIAVRILREIRKQKSINGMTQKMLADEMGVSPQYINKVVKGKENLTLETISKIEEVLGITLLEVPDFKTTYIIKQEDIRTVSSIGATSFVNYKLEYTNDYLTDSICKYG